MPTAFDQAISQSNATASDPRDMTDLYNTKLTPKEEEAFQGWLKANGKQNDLYDYDLRGAFSNGDIPSKDGRGHLPDTFKKPNHPTFSDESQYHGVDGNVGGTWGREGDRDTFTPSKTNLQNMSPSELSAYFQSVEPEAILKLPTGTTESE